MGSLALFLVTLGVLTRPYVFNSDDVGLQTVLDTWRPGRGDVRVGEDTFLLKAPLYLLANAIGTSKAVLVATSLVLNGIGWILLLLGGRTLLRRWVPTGGGAPAALWLAGMGGVFGTLLLRPNIRNVEIGLAVALLAWMATLGDGWPARSVRRRALETGALVLLLGALFVDDPYFAYVVFAPVTAVVAAASLLRADRRARWWFPAAVLAAALVVWQVALAGLRALDFHPRGEPREAPGPGELGTALTGALDAVRTVANGGTTLTGDSWWWDVRATVNLIVLVVVLAAGLWVLVRVAGRDPWALAVAALPAAVVAAHVVSGHSLREGTERYVVLVVVIAAVFAAAALGALPRVPRRALTAGLGIALAANLLATTSMAGRGTNPGNVRSEVVPMLAREGLDRGYGDFWYANTITYVSDFEVDALPVLCANGRTQRRLSYVDASRFEATDGGSFYLHDPDLGSCSLEQLEAQFGPPARTVPLTLGRRVLVYDYDLADQIR